MSLDNLLAALERDATAQAERLVVQARAEADRLIAAADAAIARRRDEVLDGRERAQRGALEGVLSAARRAARRDVLEARDRLLDRVFTAARAELPRALAQPAYRATLAPRVAAALACVGDAEASFRCPAPLAKDLRAAAAADGRITVCVDPAAGSGFRLRTADGTLEVDDTLESRLEARRPRLARDALRRLEVEP